MKDAPLPPSSERVGAKNDVSTRTIGEAWLDLAEKILNEGHSEKYDGLVIRELIMPTLLISSPRSHDPLIDRFADPTRLEWMHANFTDFTRVAALGDAASYATRLYDYDHQGIDQIEWVIERLKNDPSSRSATITTFQPLSDTTYIPCVSLLDFFVQRERLDLVVYAHSIDFGTKGFANLVELAYLQERVAMALAVEIGQLTFIVKSAHVYETEINEMTEILQKARAAQ
jgi:thymidylate synthase